MEKWALIFRHAVGQSYLPVSWIEPISWQVKAG